MSFRKNCEEFLLYLGGCGDLLIVTGIFYLNLPGVSRRIEILIIMFDS